MSEANEYAGAVDRGLEGVVACSTAISTIAGTTLLYRGYTIEDLAAHATFEEVAHLLWFGRLPSADEFARFQRQLDDAMALPAESFGWFHGLPTDVHPMDFLHAVVAGLSLHDPDANVLTYEANLRKAVRLTARLATIIAAYDRVRSGQWPLQPMPGRSIAWNFLYMLHGKEPSARRVRQFDTCLMLHADHELNASAFSARVTSSTLSGMYSSVMAAIGTLKGELHGGANEQVMRMLLEIGSPKTSRGVSRRRALVEAQGDGLRAPRLQGRRSARGDPEADERRTHRRDRPARAVRDERGDRGVHARPQGTDPERRFLLGHGLLQHGNPDRPVHARVRGEPGRRLVCARPRAVLEQPDLPAARPLRGTARPALRRRSTSAERAGARGRGLEKSKKIRCHPLSSAV